MSGRLIPLLVGFGLGCADERPCEEVRVDFEELAPPVEEAAVWDALSNFRAHRVEWDEAADGTTTAALDLGIERDVGDAKSVAYRHGSDGEWCSQSTLDIPIVLSTDVGDGAVVQRASLSLRARSDELSGIEVYDQETLNDDVVADVNEEWGNACTGQLSEKTGGAVAHWLAYDGAFSDLYLSIGGRTSDRVAYCWWGRVVPGTS